MKKVEEGPFKKVEDDLLILSFLISSFDQVSECSLFRKIVWNTWSFNGLVWSVSFSIVQSM